MVFAIAGIFVGTLIDNYGARVVCITGAITSACGLLATSFTPNLYMIYATYGVIGGW
jgi:hypothetical protein